jgi:hypothetical protein
MSAVSKILWPFKAVFSRKSHEAKSGEYGGWSNFIIHFFGQKLQRALHDQGHYHDARSKHQAKFQVFSDEQPYVTLVVFPNNNAGSLFDLV